MAAISGIGGERYWVHIPATKPRAYKTGGLVAAAKAAKGSPMANELGDSELVHVNKYEMEQLREMWGEPTINPETGLPAYGLFKTLGKIAKGIAKVAATVALTPVLGPVGASMAVSAADTAISGGSFKDVVKSAALSGATAGAGQLGAKFAPSLGVSADVGRAVGSGLGTTAGQVATGASLSDALMSGAGSGLSTYSTNKLLGSAIKNDTLGIGRAYSGLTNLGKDISNLTGIGGPPGGYTSRMDIRPVEGAADLRTYGDSLTQMPGSDLAGGDIVVTGRGLGLSLGPTFKFNSDTGKIEEEQPYTPPGEEIIVTGNGTGLTLGGIGGLGGGGVDTLNADITQDEDGTILVNGVPASNLNLGPVTTDTNDDGTVDEQDKGIVVTGTNPAVTVDGTIFNPDSPGVVTPLYPSPPATTTSSGIVPKLVPSGGRYTETPLNRGLASIGFDPFTYGQAVNGGQLGEYLFFTEDGKPYGSVGDYTGPGSGAGIGGGTETGTGGRLTFDEDTVAGDTSEPTTTTTTAPATAYQTNLKNPAISSYFKTVNDSLGSFYKMGQMTDQQVRDYQQKMYDAINTPGATAETFRAAVPMPQYTMFNKPTGTPGKQRYTAAEIESAVANIPQQTQALTSAPAAGLTAGQYYNQFVAPLAGSYFQSGKLTAEQARGLTNAASPFIASNDLAGAQSAVSAALASSGLAAPAMKDGGEADDDMVSHLISYHKNGGHNGPGRVKGIGSGQEDKIPAWLSDGEYVWSAQDVADLGDGSTDEGVRRLDKMRQMVRKQAGRKDVKNIAKPQQGIDRMLKAVGGAV
jgi:hypothetical protein